MTSMTKGGRDEGTKRGRKDLALWNGMMMIMMIAPSFCYERVRSRRIFSLLVSVALLSMKLRFLAKIEFQEGLLR